MIDDTFVDVRVAPISLVGISTFAPTLSFVGPISRTTVFARTSVVARIGDTEVVDVVLAQVTVVAGRTVARVTVHARVRAGPFVQAWVRRTVVDVNARYTSVIGRVPVGTRTRVRALAVGARVGTVTVVRIALVYVGRTRGTVVAGTRTVARKTGHAVRTRPSVFTRTLEYGGIRANVKCDLDGDAFVDVVFARGTFVAGTRTIAREPFGVLRTRASVATGVRVTEMIPTRVGVPNTLTGNGVSFHTR